jgi:hypothetical protein
MDIKTDNKDIINMLKRNEIAIAELYGTYGRKYPKKQKFWKSLSNEEIQHARLIEKLSKRKDLKIADAANRFSTEVFKISFQYLEEKKHQAEEQALSLKEALTISLDIETGMLERGYFKVFEGDSPEFQNTLKALDAATQKHCNKIRDLLASKNWSFF